MTENNTPIMEFESDEQLQSCIEEWKKVLFLEHWIIRGMLCDEITDSNGYPLLGNNEFQMVNASSLVKIARPNKENTDCIVKYCAEEILVHELLHCKYNWLCKSTESIEYSYFDTLEHGLIEQMAKSLIMAKYNLPFEWFSNF